MSPDPEARTSGVPLRIGLTGGIGSGKSRVADQLAELGAAVIDTDVIAHALTAPGGAAIAPLRALFGENVITEAGALDRPAMRELVFRNPKARASLERLLHPMIGAEVQLEAARRQGLYQVFVVPLLVESAGRWRNRVDRICVIDCDPATQIARVGTRSGLSPEAVQRIMDVQAARDERLAMADDIVVNDGRTTAQALRANVQALHDHYVALAAQRSRDTPGQVTEVSG